MSSGAFCINGFVQKRETHINRESLALPAVRWHTCSVSRSFAPGILVASPTLSCPVFNHSVVLLVDHGSSGSFGFVINKRSRIDFERIVRELEFEITPQTPVASLVVNGGPVSPETGWILFDPKGVAPPSEEIVLLDSGLALTASFSMLGAIAAGHAPSRFLLSLGYAGWDAGQLENEMRDGSWIPVDFDLELLFDVPLEMRWESALAKLGIDPARVVSHFVPSA